MQVRFQYLVTEQVLKDEIIETGKPEPKQRTFTSALDALTPGERALVVELVGATELARVAANPHEVNRHITIALGADNCLHFTPTFESKHSCLTAQELLDGLRACIAARNARMDAEKAKRAEKMAGHLATLRSEPTGKERHQASNLRYAIEHTPEDVPGREEALALLPEWEQKHEAVVKALEEQNAAACRATLEAYRATCEAEEKARREEREERQKWAQEHGSKRLKRGLEAGYDCKRLYVMERADSEFAGFVADFDENAEWKDRSCPSEAALDMERAVEANLHYNKETMRVLTVWLTCPPVRDDEDYDWSSREAVVIRGFLGKYDLISETGQD